MKITIPAKTIELCDICHRETKGFDTCTICGRKFCFLCHSFLPGCMIEPDVCKKCDDREDVKKVVERYSRDFVKIFKLRDKALAKLPKVKTPPAQP